MNQMENFEAEVNAAADVGVDSGTTSTQHNTGEEKPQVNAGAIRKTTTQNILKAAQNATGMEFNSVEEMMAALARLSAQNSSTTNQANQSTQQQVAQAAANEAVEQRQRITNNDLAEQMAAMKREMELKEQRLREKELDSSILNAMGDKFDSDLTDYTINKIKSQLHEQDGEYIVVNAKNQQRFTQDGNPMTVRELIDEVARTNPKLLRQAPVQGGSGLRPQSNMFGDGIPGDGEFVPDYTRDPAAFNAWANKRGLGKGAGLRGITATVSNSTQVRKIVG